MHPPLRRWPQRRPAIRYDCGCRAGAAVSHIFLRTADISAMKMLKRRRSLKMNESVDDLTRSSKKNKRTYLTRSSTKNKIIRNEGETTELLISGDLHLESSQVVWNELSEQVVSKLSKSGLAFSIQWTHGVIYMLRHSCETQEEHYKVKVCHKDNVIIGFLGEYDLDCNFAVVNAKNFLDLETVGFRYLLEFPPDGNVVSVGHEISGNLTTTSGILKCDLSRSVPSLVRTTCKISKYRRNLIHARLQTS
ncbi:hypothetical protein PVAP13_5KG775400 [Panicum virgatum]|uniref:Uncharacterized protein n=1 Tax=Panicum virgatum TaxID=38727 RepID=A0A8T0T2K4_PANVG|nr:hypothetical protein PVAP13_5KG775400 [Panicum virgatum]